MNGKIFQFSPVKVLHSSLAFKQQVMYFIILQASVRQGFAGQFFFYGGICPLSSTRSNQSFDFLIICSQQTDAIMPHQSLVTLCSVTQNFEWFQFQMHGKCLHTKFSHSESLYTLLLFQLKNKTLFLSKTSQKHLSWDLYL